MCRCCTPTSSRSRARPATPTRWSCRPAAAASRPQRPGAGRQRGRAAIWAIPKEVEADPAKRRELAKALGINKELEAKLNPESRFVWLKRLADDETGRA
jgi:hypothetical protein